MCDLTLNEMLYVKCPCDGCHYASKEECDKCIAYTSWIEKRKKRAIALKGLLKIEAERMFAC